MMERRLEPELMEDSQQAQAYAAADFSEVNSQFVEKFMQHFPNITGNIVDIGCGPCDIVFRLLEKLPNIHVTAVDGSLAMLDLAKKDTRFCHYQEQINCKHCRFQQLMQENIQYEAILSNSLLHHLENPKELWQTIKKISQKETAVMLIDLFRPASEEKAKEIVEQNAANELPILKEDFYNSLLAAFTKEEVEEQLQQTGLSQLKVEIISQRHLMVLGRI